MLMQYREYSIMFNVPSSNVLQDPYIYSGVVIFFLRELTGGEVRKQELERPGALDARLLADHCGQRTLLQEVFCRVGLVKGDRAKLAGESQRCDRAAAAVHAAGSKKSALISGCAFRRCEVCS